jgi:uncharacterized membrane protein YfhO
MLTPAHETARYRDIIELADVIDDDTFYRVRSDKEYSGRDFDVNHMAGIGYHALGHFTSLTKDNYMTAIKQFGYTSYWMEVGNSGGTILSDALLSVKYEISTKRTAENIYKGAYYTITPTVAALPLGIIAQDDIIQEAETTDYSYRGTLQKILAQDFFGRDDFVTTYTLDDATVTDVQIEKSEKGYKLTPTKSSGGAIVFDLKPTEATTFYFNVFDENSNKLNQSINERFSVSSPKYSISSFPVKKTNGLVCLGEYNATFKVTIKVLKTADVQDIGIVGIQADKLAEATQTVKTVGMRSVNNGFKGEYQAEGGECVFLSVPYDSGLRLKINGKKADLHEVYDGFIGFYLKEGTNKIEISYRTPGFIFGFGLFLIGVGLFVLVCPLDERKKQYLSKIETERFVSVAERIAFWGLIAVGVAVIVAIYIFPMIISGLT